MSSSYHPRSQPPPAPSRHPKASSPRHDDNASNNRVTTTTTPAAASQRPDSSQNDQESSPSQLPSINLATESYLQLIETSSEQKFHPASNLIKDSSEDYISQASLPQDVTIHLEPPISSAQTTHQNAASSEPILYNAINFAGWHCSTMHSNLSPKLVRLYVARYDADIRDPKYEYWCTLRAKKSEGTHLFKLKPVPKEYTKFRFHFLENFTSSKGSDSNTSQQLIALNRIFLVSQDLNLDIAPPSERHKSAQHISSPSPSSDDEEEDHESPSVIALGHHGEPEEQRNAATGQMHSTLQQKHTTIEKKKRSVAFQEEPAPTAGNLTDITDGLESTAYVSRSRPAPRKTAFTDDNEEEFLHEERDRIHHELNDTSRHLESLHQDFSQLLQHATTKDQESLRKKYTQMQDSIVQCQDGIRHVKLFMNQLSDRVQMLEGLDLKKFIVEQKRTNIGLNNRVGKFKKTFRDQTDEKLKRAYEKIEKKLEDRMRLMFKRHKDTTERQIQRILEKNLVNLRIRHPENEKIREYNDKVQYVNRQQVRYNARVYQQEKPTRPTKQHLQKKYLPEFFDMEGDFIQDDDYAQETEEEQTKRTTTNLNGGAPQESEMRTATAASKRSTSTAARTERQSRTSPKPSTAEIPTSTQIGEDEVYTATEQQQLTYEEEDMTEEAVPDLLAQQLREAMQQEGDIMHQLSASLKKYNFQF